MKFEETPLIGAWVIEPERSEDGRGHFARTFDAAEFARRGLEAQVIQCSTSYNHRAGTLRGMHYQAAPHGEPKLIRCTRGAIFDVIVDLREDSPTRLRWFGVELSEDDGCSLYVPIGLAQGFQTLVDASEVHYQMGHEYVPDAARGVRWDDPAFAIDWPAAPAGGRIISERDRAYLDLAA
jgi:dTDP-4-dehydrorhamnose 3,5-epimerase